MIIIMIMIIYLLDSKLSSCSEDCIISLRWIPGVWILYAEVSEHTVSSIFIGTTCLNTLAAPSQLFLLFTPPMKMGLSVPKRRHIKFSRRGIAKEKECNMIYLSYLYLLPSFFLIPVYSSSTLHLPHDRSISSIPFIISFPISLPLISEFL
jgi:hypothetical protein